MLRTALRGLTGVALLFVFLSPAIPANAVIVTFDLSGSSLLSGPPPEGFSMTQSLSGSVQLDLPTDPAVMTATLLDFDLLVDFQLEGGGLRGSLRQQIQVSEVAPVSFAFNPAGTSVRDPVRSMIRVDCAALACVLAGITTPPRRLESSGSVFNFTVTRSGPQPIFFLEGNLGLIFGAQEGGTRTIALRGRAPEPSTAGLVALGLLALAGHAARLRRATLEKCL